jgi:hypothetical protein
MFICGDIFRVGSSGTHGVSPTFRIGIMFGVGMTEIEKLVNMMRFEPLTETRTQIEAC